MNEGKHWLVRRRSIRALWIVFVAVLAIVAVGDVLIHGHPYFGLDGFFAFYAWYGFLTCIGMILFAKAVGAFLKREDTYYDGE
ncbi:MAG: hypothetical protein QGI63_07030 [Rhodospirillales bacterium]|mgnify:CR=1 FL=1|jgi:hypothetical protein|nr:hypothetical protein [Rhodospirillales bacterium]MDP6774007.1 hypothetical protein [Rhodospirillales bacterium]